MNIANTINKMDEIEYCKIRLKFNKVLRLFNSQQVLRLLLTCEGILGVSKHKNSTIIFKNDKGGKFKRKLRK